MAGLMSRDEQAAAQEIINTLSVADNEGNDSPFWLIIDPRQMMSPDCFAVASMITGPFFSREDATAHLKARRYNFSKRAVVYSHSGYWSWKYKNFYRAIEKTTEENKIKDSANFNINQQTHGGQPVNKGVDNG